MTDPVGFITVKVPGTGGTTSSVLSFPGLSLTRRVEYEGVAEAVGSNSLTDTDASWVDNQFNGAASSYYLEITSGPGAGTMYDITGTAAATKTLTIAQPLAAGVGAGVKFKIRKTWTFGSVFGTANPPESGLQPGLSTTSADEVLLYIPSTSAYESYFYCSGGFFGVGWRRAASMIDRTSAKIGPQEGPLIRRKQASDLKMILTGSVKTGQTSIVIVPGTNFVSNVYAAPMTLASSGLYTGNPATGLNPGSASTADIVQVPNGANYDMYYYSNTGLPGVGWRKTGAGAADMSNVVLPAGRGFIIKRVIGTGFNWVAPQHPSAL